MRNSMKYSLIGLILLLVATLFFLLVQIKKMNQIMEIDKAEISTHIETFHLESDKTDLSTAVQGTVFYTHVPGKQAHAQIVATFHIDPLDWGGVEFNFPADWMLTGVKSSYPEEIQGAQPDSSVVIWRTPDTHTKWRNSIQIARDSIAADEHSGGSGTIVIDLVQINNNADDALHFSVAVGSAINNGIKIVGPDFIEVQLQGSGEYMEE